MKMLSLFAAAAGFTLLGAAPPPPMAGPDGYAPSGYPPCSRSVRDRCIQLYERGVANPRNLALNDRLGPGREPRRWAHRGMGRMGPDGPAYGPAYGAMGSRRIVVASNDYPPCGAGVDDRCLQAPAATYATRRIVRVHYDRETVRLGERG
jgi:hypothetical protein